MSFSNISSHSFNYSMNASSGEEQSKFQLEVYLGDFSFLRRPRPTATARGTSDEAEAQRQRQSSGGVAGSGFDLATGY